MHACLKYIPPKKTLKKQFDGRPISTGYLKFTWPFDEISKISISSTKNVVIESPLINIILVTPMCYSHEQWEKDKEFSQTDEYKEIVGDPSKYTQRLVPKKGEMVLVPYYKNEWEKRIENTYHDPLLAQKEILFTQPKPFFSLLFMNIKDLEAYLFLCENKCIVHQDQKAFLFEVNEIEGLLSFEYHLKEKPSTVLLNDKKNTICQLVMIIYKSETFPVNEIEQFFSSFVYSTNKQYDNLDEYGELVINSLKNYPEYVNTKED